ncbi:hypothetical protein HZS55_12180 [Halosimplex rubrum]|uniref:Uncharacterized protein n=1 Tax=Halosimplex rubrum TaxID=869889 RepID=A0A7D5SYN0_9EURY|nr:hypothetical protein [Halosimplex rubrum]QLH78011.1 hypothetical protein HZS55_12180 [Halosimplex rubrum]
MTNEDKFTEEYDVQIPDHFDDGIGQIIKLALNEAQDAKIVEQNEVRTIVYVIINTNPGGNIPAVFVRNEDGIYEIRTGEVTPDMRFIVTIDNLAIHENPEKAVDDVRNRIN